MACRLGNITFDCADVMGMAHFWSAVLDRPVDNGAGEEFASIGAADHERSEPAMYFNRVPELKSAKNRVHLDLFDADPASIDRLLALGARVVAETDWGFHSWTVLEDPEGNAFCVAARSFEEAQAAR